MCGFVTLTLVLFSSVESDLEIISFFLTGNKASETKQSRKKRNKKKADKSTCKKCGEEYPPRKRNILIR